MRELSVTDSVKLSALASKLSPFGSRRYTNSSFLFSGLMRAEANCPALDRGSGSRSMNQSVHNGAYWGAQRIGENTHRDRPRTGGRPAEAGTAPHRAIERALATSRLEQCRAPRRPGDRPWQCADPKASRCEHTRPRQAAAPLTALLCSKFPPTLQHCSANTLHPLVE